MFMVVFYKLKYVFYFCIFFLKLFLNFLVKRMKYLIYLNSLIFKILIGYYSILRKLKEKIKCVIIKVKYFFFNMCKFFFVYVNLFRIMLFGFF